MRLPVRCVRCAVHLSPWLGPMHCYAFPIGSKVIFVLFIICRLCHLISGVVLCPFRCDLPCSRAVTFLRELSFTMAGGAEEVRGSEFEIEKIRSKRGVGV